MDRDFMEYTAAVNNVQGFKCQEFIQKNTPSPIPTKNVKQ